MFESLKNIGAQYHPKTRGPIDATVHLPGSKSYSNRALLIAALANGTTQLKHLLSSNDTVRMRQALGLLGVSINVDVENDIVSVLGSAGHLREPSKDLYLENAGTATRFLSTAGALVDGQLVITGNERMQERPIQDLLDGLVQLGVDCKSATGCPPVTLKGPSLKGGLTRISGQISSQFISSILISAPYAQSPVTIEITDDLVSKPYIDITLDIMKKFGICVTNENYLRFEVPQGIYQACDYIVEPDASGASYFLNAAAITGGKAKVFINTDSVQGDLQYYKLLQEMGCKVDIHPDHIYIEGGPLKAIDVDMEAIPDMVQSLAVLAAYAEGTTVIRNVYNCRVKETDRLEACYQELTKMGIQVEQTKDSLTIHGGQVQAAEIDTYDDHRMAMAFSIAGLKTENIVIKDPKCVSKTFPSYWELFENLK